MNSHIFKVFAIRSFSFLWIAEVFTQVAMNMLNFILIIVAFSVANSNAAVSGLVLSYTVPPILLGLFAGIYVDRIDKKKVLLFTNLARGILLIGLAFFHASLPVIYIFSFLTAVVTQFFIPAEIPMLPLVVKKDMLLSANAFFGIGVYGSALLGYALSGPFLLLFGKRDVFFILALLFFIAGFFITLVKVGKKEKERVENKKNFLASSLRDELKIAIGLITKTKRIYYSLLLLTLSQIIILILAVIGPGFAKQILGISIDQFPIFFATPAAFGMVCGALFIGNFLHKFSRQKLVHIGIFLSALAILALPYGSKVTSKEIVHIINFYLPHIFTLNILHIMVFLSFLLGFANALVFVPSNTVLQEETSDELRGKVYGALSALMGIFSIIPIVIVGELADVLGVSSVLSGIGASLLAFGILRVLFLRRGMR